MALPKKILTVDDDPRHRRVGLWTKLELVAMDVPFCAAIGAIRYRFRCPKLILRCPLYPPPTLGERSPWWPRTSVRSRESPLPILSGLQRSEHSSDESLVPYQLHLEQLKSQSLQEGERQWQSGQMPHS
jgi:hypothetical protein